LFLSSLVFMELFAQIAYSCLDSNIQQVEIKIIVPAYFPLTEYVKQKILSNAEHVVLIANVGTPPRVDMNLRKFIMQLVSKGGTVLGYIHTSWGSRNISYVKNDVDLWIQYYPEINGFFIDEVSNELRKLSYYEDLYKYIKSKGDYFIMLNPGTLVPTEYNNVGDSIMILEERYYTYSLMSEALNPSKYKNPAIIVYDVKPEKALEVIRSLINRGFKYIYVYDAPQNIYDHLTRYFDLMVECLSSLKTTYTNNTCLTSTTIEATTNQNTTSTNMATAELKHLETSTTPLASISTSQIKKYSDNTFIYTVLILIIFLVFLFLIYTHRKSPM